MVRLGGGCCGPRPHACGRGAAARPLACATKKKRARRFFFSRAMGCVLSPSRPARAPLWTGPSPCPAWTHAHTRVPRQRKREPEVVGPQRAGGTETTQLVPPSLDLPRPSHHLPHTPRALSSPPTPAHSKTQCDLAVSRIRLLRNKRTIRLKGEEKGRDKRGERRRKGGGRRSPVFSCLPKSIPHPLSTPLPRTLSQPPAARSRT